MSDAGFFYQAFVFLLAAVLSVPIAKRFGLGSVLGYLLAGMFIGPFGLGLLGAEGKEVLHFAEFGVVMMLFLVGLELEPSLLWRMRTPILGLGGMQVLLTSLAIAAIPFAFGLRWQEALAIGLILALSSTAIVLQTLQEKGWMKRGGGQRAFAVLLFQDIIVIPMLVFFPLLATHRAKPGALAEHQGGWIADLPGWAQSLAVLGAIAAVIVLGRFGMRPAFRYIARTRMREIFVAAALLLVIGVDLLMTKVGLSPALGSFLAGVVLAGSEYKREIESDIEPFKGLLLGLFFIAVGATINFDIVLANPGTIAGLVVALMVGKLLVLLLLGRFFGLSVDQNLLFGVSLAQGGEFAFVLFSFAKKRGVLLAETTAELTVVVVLSMAMTPLAVLLFDRVIRPRIGTKKTSPDYDEFEGDHPVIIAGFGRFGQICSRLLSAEGIGMTVLEYDSDQVDLLRKFGRHVYYGDASRYDLLKNAGAEQAQLLILAVDRPDKALEMVETAKKHFPQLKILARARGRVDAYDLMEAGVDHVFRETFDSALNMGKRALELLGHRRYTVHRHAQRFKRFDEQMVRQLAGRHRDADFIDRAKQANAEAEAVMREDRSRGRVFEDHSWDSHAIAEDPHETPRDVNR